MAVLGAFGLPAPESDIMHVIITGSRRWLLADAAPIYQALENCKAAGMQLLIHGGCDGVDSIADKWAEDVDMPCVCMAARWLRRGHSAGPHRNGQMLAAFPTAIVLAFPDGESRGTWDCVRQATQLRRTVHVYEEALPEIPF